MPVRVTDCSVTEEAFDTEAQPDPRQGESLGMRVLSVDDLGFTHKGGALYMIYQQNKERLAQRATGGTLALLGLTGIRMTNDQFPPTSRYHDVEIATLTTSDGRTIAYLRRRVVPPARALALLREHTVRAGRAPRPDRGASTSAIPSSSGASPTPTAPWPRRS